MEGGATRELFCTRFSQTFLPFFKTLRFFVVVTFQKNYTFDGYV